MLAVVGGLLYPLSDLWLTKKEHGWGGMRQQWRARLKYSFYIAAIWWGCLFSYHLLKTVPEQIYSSANLAPIPMPLSPPVSPDALKALALISRRIHAPSAPDKSRPVSEPLTLLFTDSPLFTEGVKEEIRRDIASFRNYLISLRLNAPLIVPPISIGSPGTLSKPLELTGPAGAEDHALFLPSGGRYEFRIYPNQKQSTDFGHNIVFLASEMSARTPVTSLYGMYVLSQFLERAAPDPDDFYWQARDLAITTGSVYFSSSFWNQKVRYSYIIEALWEIRGTLGQKFTDQLIAYAVRAFNESIYKSQRSDLTAYLYTRMKDADDIIDNDGAAMKTITEVWTKYKLPVSGPFVSSH
jgi:hypothetical protein